LARVEFEASSERTSPEFPWLLITGRTLYQFNAGTMTRRTGNVQLRPADLVDVSPSDAQELRLRDGQRVRVRSRYGQAELPVRINPAMRRGELFATFATAEAFLNQVTSPQRDRVTLTLAADGRQGLDECRITEVPQIQLGASRLCPRVDQVVKLDGGPQHFARHAFFHRRLRPPKEPHHALLLPGIPQKVGTHEALHELEKLRRDFFDAPKIHQADRPVRGEEIIAGMRIGVQRANAGYLIPVSSPDL
jgi:formylmethanofuran dehydrogenase subunit D